MKLHFFSCTSYLTLPILFNKAFFKYFFLLNQYISLSKLGYIKKHTPHFSGFLDQGSANFFLKGQGSKYF